MMVESLHASSFEDLYEIHSKEYNIAFMDISHILPRELENYLIEQFDKIPTMFKCIIAKDMFEETIDQLNELYYILDDSDKKTELINFVKTLVSHFADVTDSPLLGVSLEKVKGDLCKHFHYDMNHLRMVYPLIGSGTLWAEEDNVQREYLGQGKNSKVILDQTKIHQVPGKTITLLKGNRHPTALGKAVVHSSPQISHTKEKRILLRIESIF